MENLVPQTAEVLNNMNGKFSSLSYEHDEFTTKHIRSYGRQFIFETISLLLIDYFASRVCLIYAVTDRTMFQCINPMLKRYNCYIWKS